MDGEKGTILTLIQRKQSSYINFGQSRQKQGSYQGSRRALYNEKGVSFPKETTILNMCAPNNRASSYVRQQLIEKQRQIDECSVIVGDFNRSLSEMDRPGREKIRHS